MRKADIGRVKIEIKRLSAAIKDLETGHSLGDLLHHYTGSKESGMVKKASMDLTRALAYMRHPWRGRK